MKLSLNDCENNIQFLIDCLDQGWLTKQLNAIKSVEESENISDGYHLKFNPLAFQIWKTRKQIALCKEDRNRIIHQEILHLALLGIYLYHLKKFQVEGLDEKIEYLMNNKLTFDQFNQTVYELSTASLFVEQGNNVKFLDTGTSKTPDLLVDGVEIECKKKDQDSERDRKIKNIWKNVSEQCSKIMNNRRKNYFIYVISENDPTPQSGKELSDFLTKAIIEDTEQNGNFKEFKISMEKGFEYDSEIESELKTDPYVSKDQDVFFSTIVKLNSTQVLEKIFSERDFGYLFAESGTKNGKVLFRNMNGVGFKSKNIPDRIKSVENNLKSAQKQFSNTKPAIIFLELNFLTANDVIRDIRKLENMISDLLRNNSRISSIVVTIIDFPEHNGKRIFYQKYFEFQNKTARYPIPNNFKIS